MRKRIFSVLLWTAVQAITAVGMADDGVFEQVKRSTVWIVRTDHATGTGVFIDADRRLVVTNSHVVGDHDEVIVFARYTVQMGTSGTASRTSGRLTV